jgi:hypothetical protein
MSEVVFAPNAVGLGLVATVEVRDPLDAVKYHTAGSITLHVTDRDVTDPSKTAASDADFEDLVVKATYAVMANGRTVRQGSLELPLTAKYAGAMSGFVRDNPRNFFGPLAGLAEPGQHIDVSRVSVSLRDRQ